MGDFVLAGGTAVAWVLIGVIALCIVIFTISQIIDMNPKDRKTTGIVALCLLVIFIVGGIVGV